mmetsp:Transcript_54/g.126  ORF Transcript_54/g.126 Transcript_54/m.126 type:complete len:132 (-) Transcript_54:354-749(-)
MTTLVTVQCCMTRFARIQMHFLNKEENLSIFVFWVVYGCTSRITDQVRRLQRPADKRTYFQQLGDLFCGDNRHDVSPKTSLAGGGYWLRLQATECYLLVGKQVMQSFSVAVQCCHVSTRKQKSCSRQELFG